MQEHYVLPPNLNKRLISTLMSSRNPDPNESKAFSLKSSRDFASRSVDVFAGLQNLEEKHDTWMSINKTIEYKDEPDEKPCFNERTNKTFKPENDLRGSSSESVFKKPFPSKPLKRKMNTNLKRKRQKWTKYSLEDIPVSSDSQNTATALQFLDELRKRRESEHEEADSSGKLLFNKPINKGHKNRVRREVQNPSEVITVSSNVKLLHLDEEDSD